MDGPSKVDALIRSQPDFTLAYRVPAKENEEEREIWERDLTKLFHEFQHVRAVAFDQMWRWRTFVLQFRKDRGILPKTPGRQAQRVCRNQNAGGGAVRTE